MIQLPMTYQACDYNICGSCSKLKVKCLEKRWFGGVDFGHCTIRSHKEMARWPRPQMELNK